MTNFLSKSGFLRHIFAEKSQEQVAVETAYHAEKAAHFKALLQNMTRIVSHPEEQFSQWRKGVNALRKIGAPEKSAREIATYVEESMNLRIGFVHPSHNGFLRYINTNAECKKAYAELNATCKEKGWSIEVTRDGRSFGEHKATGLPEGCTYISIAPRDVSFLLAPDVKTTQPAFKQ